MAASTAKYRDLIQVNQFIVQLWMFWTPIVYPLSEVPSGILWLSWLNPMTVIVEGFRFCLLGHGTVTPTSICASLLGTIVILITGTMIFQKIERTVVDTI
jgi:lipopolysaccharide transport system permease protein